MVKVNLNIPDLQPEDRFILACLQHQPKLPELNFDEDRLIHRMAYHRVTSMVYQHLMNIDSLYLLSVKTQAKLKEQYRLNIYQNLAISSLIKQLSCALSANNIEIMVLKGAMFIESFPDYAQVREMSDLDIMVKSKKLDPALEVLSTIGFANLVDFNLYKSERKKWYLHNLANAIPLQSQCSNIPNVLIEIHWQLFSSNNQTIWSEKDVWNRAKYCYKNKVYYLDPIDALLHLCAHQCNNLQIYLYGLVDVANLLLFWREKIDWSEVIRRAKSQRLLLHLVNILRLCHELLDTPLPEVYFSELKAYEVQANPGYYFLLEWFFQKELIEQEPNSLSLSKVFRRLEYSNLWQRLWCETKLLIPRSVRLRLNYHIGRHLSSNY